MLALLSICAVFCVINVVSSLLLFRESRYLIELSDLKLQEPKEWPSLSVIITACNEEETIESALTSLLSVDYPALELIAVNDRSTDETGKILDRLAQKDSRLRVMHIEELPEKWLGKVHAMDVGMRASTAEFVLYCDADVHFGPKSLRRALAWVVQEELDHLSLIPKIKENDVVTSAFMLGIGSLWMLGTRPSRINQDKEGGFGASGAFNLARRTVYDKTEGWTWLKMDIADDVGFAYMMYRHDAKSRMATASQDLELDWYPSTVKAIQGFEKNMFPCAAQFSVARTLSLSFGAALCFLCPIALLFTSWFWVGLIGIFGPMMAALFSRSFVSWFPRLLSTQTGLLVAFTLLWSMVKTLRRGSVDWRGTQYRIEDLKAEQRVKF